MSKHNPKNERIKRRYFAYLKEAKRNDEQTVDAVAKALSRFESYTKYRDFKSFHIQQAINFKKHLTSQVAIRSGKSLSKATLSSTLSHLKRFYLWLAGQPGFRSALQYSDAEYFNLSEKETRIAGARRTRPSPTIEQIKRVINEMPCETSIEKRNRALIAFTLLTGARDMAIASFKLKHVDLDRKLVFQDARDVKTKFSKTFTTYFFPVGKEVEKIVTDWIVYLRNAKQANDNHPLFPATRIEVGSSSQFEATGLLAKHWATASPIRRIFRQAFNDVGLPYFHPHSVRSTLTRLGMKICKSGEDFKAWSKNLGHDDVKTTYIGYGELDPVRQGEVLRHLHSTTDNGQKTSKELLRELEVAMERERA